MKGNFHKDMVANVKSASSFLSRVRDGLHDMRPAERRVADFVLNVPGDLAGYTATEVAKLANVSNATISRFMRRLGYANYDEARRKVRDERGAGAALFMVSSRSATPEGALVAHIEQGRANLASTFAGITLAEIDAVANSMLKARRVWVIGFRTSHSFATYLHWQTFQVIDTIAVVPGAGQTLAEHITAIDKGDCVIVFGLRREVRQFRKILDLVVKTGASVLYITDADISRRKGPTWHFRCQTVAPGPLFNHVAVLGLCHLLATRVVELAGCTGRRRLSAIELVHEAIEEL